jgi:hypothetical protein
MHSWAEDKLLDYHEEFGVGNQAAGSMENVVSLAVLVATMREALVVDSGGDLSGGSSLSSSSISGSEQVERYIKSSVRRAFIRVRMYVLFLSICVPLISK